MKGLQGLLVAIALGVTGSFLNFIYLGQKAREAEKVAFVGISEKGKERGKKFSDSDLVPVFIPKNSVGELRNFGVYYKDRDTVTGMVAIRNYAAGELLMQQDLKTPPPELKLQSDAERAMWIPVDTKTLVPSLIVPGDLVSFIVPRLNPAMVRAPTSSQSSAAGGGEGGPKTDFETIGPFRVLSLGNRLGSADVMRAAKIAQLQENVMTVSVMMDGDELEPKAAKLWDILNKSNFKQVGVLLHPRK